MFRKKISTLAVKKVLSWLKNKEIKDNGILGLSLKICGQIYEAKFECLKLSKITIIIANLSLIFSLNSKFAE